MTNEELNKIIAEKLMGIDISKYPIEHQETDVENKTLYSWKEGLPNYTDNITAAWAIVEKLRSLGHVVDMLIYPEYGKWVRFYNFEGWILQKTDYSCMFTSFLYDRNTGTPIGVYQAEGKTAAEAICNAALKVIENDNSNR